MTAKEVQKMTIPLTTHQKLYLSIFQLIKADIRPSKICENLGIKKQKLQYYLSSLKSSGFIEKIGYGVWEIKKEFDQKEVQKMTMVGRQQVQHLNQKEVQLLPDKIRGHSFQFVIQLPKDLKGWKSREDFFKKIGLQYSDLILGGVKRGQRIIFKDHKVWMTDKSIIVYERASYFADTGQDAKNYAVSDLLSLIKSLEKELQANFSFAGSYKFRVSRQHYALIKNALAKQYDREGKKLQVFDDRGLWFLIDNSFNLHEAEVVHPKSALDDSKKVQDYFNGIKHQEGYTPSFVVNSIGALSENWNAYGQNIKSHIKAIQDLGAGIEQYNKGFKELISYIKRKEDKK